MAPSGYQKIKGTEKMRRSGADDDDDNNNNNDINIIIITIIIITIIIITTTTTIAIIKWERGSGKASISFALLSAAARLSASVCRSLVHFVCSYHGLQRYRSS